MQEQPPAPTALITGGVSGIGLAITRNLLSKGYRTAAIDNDAAVIEQVSAELASLGHVTTVAADISDADEAQRAVDACASALGRLDVVVNNAGILGPAEFLTDAPGDIERVILVNLCGAMWISRAALVHMKAQGAGSIVNIASIVAQNGAPDYPAYSASKAGLIALTKSLARKHARSRIRVNCISPGSVSGTRLQERACGIPLTTVERLALVKKIPLGKRTEPDDIGEAVAFLASPAASSITGAVLVVDGGEMLGL